MKRFLLVLFTLSFSQAAMAGPLTNQLANCFFEKTSEADKVILMQWLFAAMSHHPEVKQLSAVSAHKAEDLNKSAANLYTDLIANRCKVQAVNAFKHEGKEALNISFETLGRVALKEMTTNTAVNQYMRGFPEHVDLSKLRGILINSK